MAKDLAGLNRFPLAIPAVTRRKLPKLPRDKRRILTYSAIRAWRNCEHQFNLAYNEGWRSKTVGKALEIGDLWHQALYYTYRNMMQPAKMVDPLTELQKYFDRLKTKSKTAKYNLRLVKALYRGYENARRDVLRPRDSKLKVVGPESSFCVPIVHPDTNEEHPYYMIAGKRDVLVEEKGVKGVWIMEHKSTGKTFTDLMDELSRGFQATIYYMAERFISGQNPQGIIFNIVRKPMIAVREKSGESEDGYFRRLEDDCRNERPDFYYFRDKVYRNNALIRTSMLDIWQTANDIAAREYFTHNFAECSMCDFQMVCPEWSDMAAKSLLRRKEVAHEELTL